MHGPLVDRRRMNEMNSSARSVMFGSRTCVFRIDNRPLRHWSQRRRSQRRNTMIRNARTVPCGTDCRLPNLQLRQVKVNPSSPGDAKPGDAKPGDAKPGDAKPGDAKPGHAIHAPVPPMPDTVLDQILDQRKQFLSFVQRRVSDPAIAEDILQAAYMRALQTRREACPAAMNP